MKGRLLYIAGWGIRWFDVDAPHLGFETHMNAEPTIRGGRPVTVRYVDADGIEHSRCYSEGLFWERLARADEGGI